MAARARDERGAVAPHVVIMPVAMALLFLVVQVSLWYYGRVVAYGAAQHALEAARAYDGDEDMATDFANQFLDQVGGLDVESVTVERTDTHARVQIEAQAMDILPWVDLRISVHREAEIERPAQ
jgi:hypothetical protein